MATPLGGRFDDRYVWGKKNQSYTRVDCSKGTIAMSVGQKVVLSFNGYWGKRSE
jgi:hypothetical protein